MKRILIVVLLLLPLVTMAGKKNKRVYIEIETTMGTIEMVLYNDTPVHRDNFAKLVREGFYDGLLFHRVIKGFMIQGGAPDSRNAAPGQKLGDGEAGAWLPAEIQPWLSHKKGSLAAARESDDVNPDMMSSSSQFYIALGHYGHLDGKYTIFGEVTRGLEVAEKIQTVDTDKNDRPLEDVRIIRARVVTGPQTKH